MLRFEILNKREVACREVKEDCMNIQDSRLFIKGVNTLLVIDELSRLEAFFYNKYSLDWDTLTKKKFSDNLIDLDAMTFDKASEKETFLDSWERAKNTYNFLKTGELSCPELNSKDKEGNYQNKTAECFTDISDMNGILRQCAYYCMSMKEVAHGVIYTDTSAKIQVYHIQGEDRIFEMAQKYADSKDNNFVVECKRAIDEIGHTFDTPEKTDILKKYSFDVKRKVALAVLDSCALKLNRNKRTGLTNYKRGTKKDLQIALACALFHMPIETKKQTIKEVYL